MATWSLWVRIRFIDETMVHEQQNGLEEVNRNWSRSAGMRLPHCYNRVAEVGGYSLDHSLVNLHPATLTQRGYHSSFSLGAV